MRLREGRDWGLLFMPMVKLVSGGYVAYYANQQKQLNNYLS